MRSKGIGLFAVAFSVALVGGCSSDSSSAAPASADAGGPVPGAADQHCALLDGGTVIQSVDPAMCMADGGMDMSPDGGMAMPNGPEFGDPMYGTQGDDDDCKYHVTWSAPPIALNGDTTLTVTLVSRATGQPVSGATPYADVMLGATHPAPGTGQTSTEGPTGTYTIGPIRFDASGQWVVRFHFFGTCMDAPDSPHGHAAFYVGIP